MSINIFEYKKNVLMIFLLLVISVLLLNTFGCSSIPKRENFDIPESFDKATCSYYTKDRKLFGASKNVKQCEKESESLSAARKENRAYERIQYCNDFVDKGFETRRECVLYID